MTTLRTSFVRDPSKSRDQVFVRAKKAEAMSSHSSRSGGVKWLQGRGNRIERAQLLGTHLFHERQCRIFRNGCWLVAASLAAICSPSVATPARTAAYFPRVGLC